MANSEDNQEHIENIAGESLDAFSKVSESAKSHLSNSSPASGSRAFASINTWTSTEAVKNKEKISQDNIEGYVKLSREPAIARMVVIDENEEKTTYYICRAAPVPVDDTSITLASC